MLRRGACPQQPPARPQGSPPRLGGKSKAPAAPLLLLVLLLAAWTGACKGAPMPSQALQTEQDLQLWNEIDDACSAYLSIDPHPQASSALEELCFMVMEFLQKPQNLDEKENTKRSFVLHLLLQLVSQLHERRLKRDKADEELQAPGGIQSRGYFLFRVKVENNTLQLTQSSVADQRKSHAMEGDQQVSAEKDPNEDTEWNDVLRDFGILPPKDEPEDETEEMVLRLQKEAEVKPYEKMTFKELNEAEDDFDEDDLKALEMYRQQRIQEWKSLQKRQKYGELREISGEQYVKEVTNAPNDLWVVIHLYRASIPMCLLVNQHLSLLARKFPEVKFVKAIVNSCIQNYHDRCLPTIFVYRNGQIKGRFIGVTECGGTNLKLEELEWKFAQVGAIKTDLEENPKQHIMDMMISSIRNASIHGPKNVRRNSDETKCYLNKNF